MNILVVDDSEDQREITGAALRAAGFTNILDAGSAAEAYAALGVTGAPRERAPVDLVLLDIVMPEADGIEACAFIRSHGRYDDIPIIMVTSLDDMESLANAFVAGANDYITKPINRIELSARVRAALKLKAELDRRRERELELLQLVSSRGDRHGGATIDAATGLFTGEVVEAYLTSDRRSTDEQVSVITLAVDRLADVRAAQGEDAARAIQAKAAAAVRAVAASIGAVAGAYRNGLMVIVAPDFAPSAAQKLAQTMREAIAQLSIGSRELVAADHLTASAAVVSGRVNSGPERAKLLTQAIAFVQRNEAAGGNQLSA